jgi:hypothetical protein
MAIINYTQEAVLGAYQQWLMQQGAQACLERINRGQDALSCANVPGAIVAQAGSQIRYTVLTTLSSATVTFSGQFQTESGMWQNVNETVVGTSAGGVDRVLRPATAGCYRTFVASVGTATVAGSEVYVLAELGRTNNGVFQPYAILTSGYVRTNEPIDMTPGPGTRNPPSSGTGGGCCLETIYSDSWDPDSLNPYTWTPASGANAKMVYLNFTHTTSGTAGNRYIYLNVGTFSGYGFEVSSTIAQPASTSYDYTFQAGGETYQNAATARNFFGIPADLWFDDVIYITIQANGVKAGDVYSFTEITMAEKGP